MELSIDEGEERIQRLYWPASFRKEVCDMALSEGVPMGSICLSAQRKYPFGSSTVSVETKSLEIARRAIDLAADIGVRIIMLAGYDVYYEPSTEETAERFLRNLFQVTEYAAKSGVTLAFETMETPFMNTTWKAMKYVNLVRSPYLQVYPDCGNVTNAFGGDAKKASEDLLNGEGHCVGLHLKETKPGVYRDLSFGKGHVDFGLMTRTAWKLGVRRYVSEYWNHGELDWYERLSEVVAFCRTHLDNAKEVCGNDLMC